MKTLTEIWQEMIQELSRTKDPEELFNTKKKYYSKTAIELATLHYEGPGDRVANFQYWKPTIQKLAEATVEGEKIGDKVGVVLLRLKDEAEPVDVNFLDEDGVFKFSFVSGHPF